MLYVNALKHVRILPDLTKQISVISTQPQTGFCYSLLVYHLCLSQSILTHLKKKIKAKEREIANKNTSKMKNEVAYTFAYIEANAKEVKTNVQWGR